jgi:hypothetical protein
MGNESVGNDGRSGKFVRILPVLRRQVVLRSRQVSWLRRKLLAVFPSPVRAPSGLLNGSLRFTVAGPRRFFTGLPY